MEICGGLILGQGIRKEIGLERDNSGCTGYVQSKPIWWVGAVISSKDRGVGRNW